MGVWPALQDTLAGAAKAITGKASQVLYDLRVNGKLTLGQGGVIRTAASGQRIELTNEDQDRIRMFTGDSWEAISGTIRSLVSGSGATRQLVTALFAPSSTGDSGSTTIQLFTETNDDSTLAPSIVFGYSGGSAQQMTSFFTGGIHANQDSATGALPALALSQDDVDIEFVRFTGTSDTNVDRALVDAANFTTPGSIAGWLKINIQDEQSSSPITDGDYYLPFYTAPTA